MFILRGVLIIISLAMYDHFILRDLFKQQSHESRPCNAKQRGSLCVPLCKNNRPC